MNGSFDSKKETGKRIRALRLQQDMTCRELAERIGVSKSMISQVERGEAYPSIPTLEKLSDALGVPLSCFFDVSEKEAGGEEAAEGVVNCVVRKGQHKIILMPETHDRYQVLTPTIGRNAFEFLLIEFPPHSPETQIDCFVHRGEECFYVLEGKLELNLDGRIYTVEAGDSGYFGSYSRHSFRNRSNRTAKTIMASTSSIF